MFGHASRGFNKTVLMIQKVLYAVMQQKRNIVLGDAIFSMLKIRFSYAGPCIKVRRDSDNTTKNIYFSGGIIDTEDLLDFVGSGNGFIHTWFDQMNDRDATQTTNANQYQIVSSGSVITADNGYPIAKSTNSPGTSMSFTALTCQSQFVVAKIYSASNYLQLTGASGADSYLRVGNNGKYYGNNYNSGDFQNASDCNFVNGSSINLSSTVLHVVSVFRTTNDRNIAYISPNNYGRSINAYIQTVILFSSDKRTDRVSIELEMASKHAIYTKDNTDTPTWGTPVDISLVGDTVVDTSGTMVFAYSYGESGGTRTINGVTFTKTSFGSGYANSGVYNRGGIGSDFEGMMDSFGWITVTTAYELSNLTPGKHYLIQFFISDCRSSRQQSFTMDGVSSETFYQNQKHSVICNFQAYSDRHIIYVNFFSGAIVLNGAQLRILD